jgi:hypothetical protein
VLERKKRYPTHRLIVVGHGFWLLKTMVVEWDEWTAGLLDSWRYKVLLTPRMPEEWDARETILSKKLRILPAILRGVGDLAETLDAIETPNFKRWQELDLDEAQPIRLPKKLKAETLMIFLESHFVTYGQGGKRDDRLLQWIAACAVPPVIHWDLTLALGQIIGTNNAETDSLVTLDAMFQLTRLSWFNDATMPDEARRPLLEWLEKRDPSVLAAVRAKWAEILTINKPPTDSLAFDDYSLALTINALNQKPTPRQKQKLNQELERSLVNEPRQDFLVLDYLDAQRTPLDAFIPKRFRDYLRDPDRRIPTLRAWTWQVPMWLLGGFLLFSVNYAPDCEGIAMTKTRKACIKDEQDILTLIEYTICDVLDKNYWRFSDVKPDSVLAWYYFAPNADTLANSKLRVDENLEETARALMERAKNLDNTSFYHNLKIAYANAAIRYINKNNKDSACLYVKLYANLQTKDSVLTAEEWNFLNQTCNPRTDNVISSAWKDLVKDKNAPVFQPNKQTPTRITPRANAAQNAQALPKDKAVVQAKDTVQQEKASLTDALSLSISGLQKDIVTLGESLNINYAVSNDGKEVMEGLKITAFIGEARASDTDIKAIPVGETVRGVVNLTIPKDAVFGKQNIYIVTYWKGKKIKSNSRTIEIGR